jgi:uncharacterized Zn-binding protein involved in type VI secretion
MGPAAAKEGDTITALDTHVLMVPSPGGPVPTPTPGHPFNGVIDNGLSGDVKMMGRKAATVDSTATNTPPHVPLVPGSTFQTPPSNRAKVTTGSATVKINGKAAARAGDKAETCNDPTDLPVGTVVAGGTVFIG